MKNNLREIFRDPPVLYTRRLILRKIEKRDCDDMFMYSSDPEVSKYLLWSPHPDRGYTAKYLAALNQRYRAGEVYDWAIEYNGRMIGTCGFASIDMKNRIGQIGYVLARDMWGMGFAAEAAKEVMDFGFDTLGLHRIEALYMEQNTRSRRVMEKLGMSFEGIRRDSMLVKGCYVSIGTCAIIKEA